ncbi:MAG: Maf family protein [Ruthenibacterium sp.]
MILASASPRRKELLALITPDYTVVPSMLDERAITAETPKALAQALACAKCRDIAQNYPRDCVIGCDTVVDVDGAVLGKPADAADARHMLQLLSGRTHLVHTGVALCKGAQFEAFAETTAVTFATLSETEIEDYLATGEPYDKAGGYGIQGAAAKFVRGVDGCYFNVMGFPVAHVYAALRHFDGVL